MKREEAIYCLKAQSERYSEVCEECPLYGQTGVDHCCEDALQMAITALQNQPVWIPVSERLPEKNGKYLVFLTNPVRNQSDNVFTSWYNVYYKEFETEKSLDYVKAWMPLPEPYRESEGK
jgi:hypothetical protein